VAARDGSPRYKRVTSITRQRTFHVIAIAAATLGLWRIATLPVEATPFTGRIDGFAYSPMQPGQSPAKQHFPTESEIARDLSILAAHSASIRTYSIDGSFASIPMLAAQLELDVTVGVWLDEDRAENRRRLAELGTLVSRNPGVRRVIIGNETLLTERLGVEELIEYLDTVREIYGLDVSTAEPWHIWLEHPDIAEHVDFVTVHLLPYWEGIDVERAVGVVEERMRTLEEAFAPLPIVIGEVGWPSNGRSRGDALAGREEAELFLRGFLRIAEQRGYEYFLMEAFDQPWKRQDEGEVGAYWGLFDGEREPKYRFEEPEIGRSAWPGLALVAASFGALAFLLSTFGARGLAWQGFTLLAATSCWVANETLFGLYEYLDRYWTVPSVLAAVLLLAGIAGMILLVLIEAHEWAEAQFKKPARLAVGPPDWPTLPRPKISIHVPTHREPPAMVIETLRGLAKLDYPSFEVIVVDNNTSDESMWRPVEACCSQLGARFRFCHVEGLTGYKAGALNYALARTAEDAEIVAVIDSDYVVEPEWLDHLSRHFVEANVAIVQAPQDYSDQHTRAFKRFCEAEYRGFFKIGMVTRNERNAIIQHGTMTMIRKRVLEEVGGWAEWTVTEDAELGLRVLEAGYDAIYTPLSYGRGLTPDKFGDYRAQRYRWALGAAQILRRHGKRLFGIERTALDRGQRFHFLTGWMGWLGDSLNLVFNLIAIAWSSLMIARPLEFYPPLATFTGFVIGLFLFKLLKIAVLYRRRIGATALETCAALFAGLSLVYIVGRAVLAGLVGDEARFVRTPKRARRDSLIGALAAVIPETVLACLLLASALGVVLTAPYDSADRTLWCLLLVTFSIPQLAALSLSLLGAMPSRRPATGRARLEAPASEASQS